MTIITRAPRNMAMAVPATPELGRNFLPGLTKLPQPMTHPKAMAQTFMGLSFLCRPSALFSIMYSLPIGCAARSVLPGGRRGSGTGGGDPPGKTENCSKIHHRGNELNVIIPSEALHVNKKCSETAQNPAGDERNREAGGRKPARGGTGGSRGTPEGPGKADLRGHCSGVNS